MRLEDRVVVVTGASGIAAAGASLFAAEGASVVVISIDPGQGIELVQSVTTAGGKAEFAKADLTIEEETVAAFSGCLDRYGRIDGLFAVAGGSGRQFGDGPVEAIPKVGWDRTIELNLTPAFLTAREAVRAMKDPRQGGGGSIVLVSSVLASHPSELFATHAYGAAKGATVSLARAMASHYARDSIRVNVIAPGLVLTPMSERAASDPASVAYAEAKQPLARGFLDPQDVARAALFLLSDESSQITGQVLEVDGGWGVTEARS
jgi:NAD(P)-dependent dehydrogenase (short-subunit alcohol dehydrogenase family)